MFDKESIELSLAAAFFGGFTRWYVDMRNGQTFKLSFFIADMLISGGVGFLAYWVAHEMGQLPSVCACIAGFAGNLGSRVFDFGNTLLQERLHLEKKGRYDGERDTKL